VLDPARARNLGVFSSVEFPHQVVADGQVAGSWKREVGRASARVSVRWYATPTARHRAALTAEGLRLGRFLSLPCEVDHTVASGS
jgi:hypothetical protein